MADHNIVNFMKQTERIDLPLSSKIKFLEEKGYSSTEIMATISKYNLTSNISSSHDWMWNLISSASIIGVGYLAYQYSQFLEPENSYQEEDNQSYVENNNSNRELRQDRSIPNITLDQILLNTERTLREVGCISEKLSQNQNASSSTRVSDSANNIKQHMLMRDYCITIINSIDAIIDANKQIFMDINMIQSNDNSASSVIGERVEPKKNIECTESNIDLSSHKEEIFPIQQNFNASNNINSTFIPTQISQDFCNCVIMYINQIQNKPDASKYFRISTTNQQFVSSISRNVANYSGLFSAIGFEEVLGYLEWTWGRNFPSSNRYNTKHNNTIEYNNCDCPSKDIALALLNVCEKLLSVLRDKGVSCYRDTCTSTLLSLQESNLPAHLEDNKT